MRVYVLNGDNASQKLILQACIPFVDLKENARFFYRTPSNPYSDSGEEKVPEYYQRRLDDKRIEVIKKYLRSAILANNKAQKVSVIFPTAMLLAFMTDDTELEVGKDGEISLPQEFFIVDGQHRLKAMMDLYEEVSNRFVATENDETVKAYLEAYKFNCTIMLNFDLWEQAQVFAEVNFTQQRVNKSLYYDIYGMRYSDNPEDRVKNCIYVAHNLVRYLNTTKESPLYEKVKMLGVGRGLVSQACLVESLMTHMSSPLGIWYIDFEADRQPTYRYMAVEVVSFFSVVKELFPRYWPKENKHQSILCKTTGIDAMIRLMGYLHKAYLSPHINQTLSATSETTNTDYMNEVRRYLEWLVPHAQDLFSFQGKYSGTGGRGLAKALYKELIAIIGRGGSNDNTINDSPGITF